MLHTYGLAVWQGWTKFYEFGWSDLRSSAEIIDGLYARAGIICFNDKSCYSTVMVCVLAVCMLCVIDESKGEISGLAFISYLW